METIESILDDARRPITARELSSDLAIASSAAKELLKTYAAEHADKVAVVYCIVGTRAGGLTVQIVGATHVASAKAALDAVASVDIHSLAPVSQAAQSDGERKTVAAEMWSASETWRRALFNGTDESSMRFKANAASAITSDLLKIRLAERERSGAPAYVAPPPVGAAPAPRAPYIAPKKAPAAKAAKAPVKKKPSMFAAKPNSKKPAVKKGAVAAPAKPAAAPKPKPMPKKGGMASFFGKKAGTASTAQKKTVAKKPTPAAPVAAGLGLAASDDEEEDSVAENASPKRTIKRKKKVGSGAKKKRRLKKKTAAEDEDAGAEGANGESGGAAPQDLFVQQETSRVAEADGDSMPDMRTEADLEKARAAKKWAQVLKAKAKEGQEDEIDRSVIQTVKMGSRTSPKKRKLVTTTFVNDEGFMVTEDRWEDVEGTSASESKKASSPKKAKAAAGSDEPAKKKATSQGSMFSFFKKK